MKDNNVVAFYCNNCHKTVWNYEHDFEQLHEKGLCAKCLKKQNKLTISKTESVDNYLCKWQKLKEWLNKEADDVRYTPYDCKSLSDDFELWHLNKILEKMQELEGEDE